jgi:hypothetical protein
MMLIHRQHLVGQQYSWLSSSFYFGYLVASYPASFGFVKFPTGKYLAVTMYDHNTSTLKTTCSLRFLGLCGPLFSHFTEQHLTLVVCWPSASYLELLRVL